MFLCPSAACKLASVAFLCQICCGFRGCVSALKTLFFLHLSDNSFKLLKFFCQWDTNIRAAGIRQDMLSQDTALSSEQDKVNFKNTIRFHTA